ncbi:hypothetical protein [Fictibacillus barbaricus]|uniref:Phosphoglycerol transferase MdoB-like AlkP superfamily enzyme n=1 Tax=Fictibacillus barbaricus TaxID=182136 RepID=A0ABU1U191_9BACL|nr:hypothetical protein [Fictibacillus barbaricus]MDR7073198.1 phosphoglycerol transferase MdoB-like AlkP superfamily enzyme [Fictibacillus barbaricus]
MYKKMIGNPIFIISIYSTVILLKIIGIRYILFHEINLIHSLFYDMPFFLLFLSLAVLLPFGEKFNLFLVNLVTSTFFFVLIVYVKYYQILPTYFDLFQVNQLGTVKEDVYDLIKPKYFIIFIDVFILFIISLLMKNKAKMKPAISSALALVCIVGISLQFYLNKNEQITDVISMANNKGILQYEMIQY